MENNQIKVFNNNEFGDVRVLEKNGSPWFVGKDVAKILGYSDTSATVSKKVDIEDKIKELIPHCQNGKVVKTQTTLINESGLYSLILSSKIPNAKKFKRWVTSDVLPSIRRHGMYATENTIDEMINNPDFGIKLLTQLKEEKLKRKQAEKIIEKQTPKVIYHDKVLNPTDENFRKLLTTSEIAKDLNMSARKLNSLLHELHIIYKQGKTWMPYAEYQDMIPTHFDYHVNEYGQVLKYTEKGRKWIIELLDKKGLNK